MNWQKEAIEDLKNYNDLKKSLTSIKAKIHALANRFTALKSKSIHMVSSNDGQDYHEDMLINNIAQRERLQMVYEANKELCERIEKGLEGLSEEQRLILDVLFVNGAENGVLHLCRKLSYEKTKIYSLRAAALKRFTVLMYGIPEY